MYNIYMYVVTLWDGKLQTCFVRLKLNLTVKANPVYVRLKLITTVKANPL